jgi:hypothetical protein
MKLGKETLGETHTIFPVASPSFPAVLDLPPPCPEAKIAISHKIELARQDTLHIYNLCVVVQPLVCPITAEGLNDSFLFFRLFFRLLGFRV